MTSESPTHPDAPRAGGETPVMRATNYALAFDLLKVAGWIAAHTLSGEKAEDQFAIVQRAVSHLRGESREPVQRLDELLRNDPWAAAIADHVRSALPALLDRPAPSDGWQPATTAPRSGEHILITQLGRAGFGYTDGVAQDWCTVAHYWPVAGEEGFYLSAGASSEIDDHPLSFTHWMPLPVVCLCDYSLANAPGVSHQPHCPLSSRAALLERHRDGEWTCHAERNCGPHDAGCGKSIAAGEEYRCLDCDAVMHKDCLRAHCSADEKDATILRLQLTIQSRDDILERICAEMPDASAGPSPERASK